MKEINKSLDDLNLNELKILDNSIFSLEQIEELELNPNILNIDILGSSGLNPTLTWLNVNLIDGSNIDLYYKKEVIKLWKKY